MTVLKISKLQGFVWKTMQAWLDGKSCCTSYKFFQLSVAIAIATFEISGWKFSGYLLLIRSFSCANKIFKSELFSCLPKVGHVIKSCKEPIQPHLFGRFWKTSHITILILIFWYFITWKKVALHAVTKSV